jgi:hypothetical protein
MLRNRRTLRRFLLTRVAQVTSLSPPGEKTKKPLRDGKHQVTGESVSPASRSSNQRRFGSQAKTARSSPVAELIAEMGPYISQAEAIQSGLQERLTRALSSFRLAVRDPAPEMRLYARDARIRLSQCVHMAEQLTYVLKDLAASKPTAPRTGTRRGIRKL